MNSDFMQNLVFEWVDFQNFPKFGKKKKFWSKLGRLVYDWATFSSKMVLIWVYFQIPSGVSLPKPKLRPHGESPKHISFNLLYEVFCSLN